MYRLIIAAHGDNEHLHREALKAAVQAVEDANPTNSVYRAYLEKIEDGKIVGVPNGHAADPSRAIDAPAAVPNDVSDRDERQLNHETGGPHHLATKRLGRTLGDMIVDFVGRNKDPVPLRRIVDEFSTWSEPTITQAVLNLADQRRLNREEHFPPMFTLGSKA